MTDKRIIYQKMTKVCSIVFHFHSRYFKLVDIEWGDDNSFYFLPLQHEAEVGSRLKAEIDNAGILSLRVNEIETGQFPTRKISRHPSGYFHIKDVTGHGGNRERDGLIGPAFKDIDGFYVFLLIFPQAIDTLVEIEKPESTDLIVHLPDLIEPFTIQFAVWDKKIRVKIPTPPGEYLGNGVIAIGNDNHDYGMVIMLTSIQKTKNDVQLSFPARTCYIVR